MEKVIFCAVIVKWLNSYQQTSQVSEALLADI